MRFSEAWLREWVNPAINTDELVEQLTMAGLEVESVEPAAANFSGVVVGEVLALQAHPNADKLRVCKVAVGAEEPLQIICGADNVRVGLKAPAALVGALLPDDFKIKKSKLRGEDSLGMLCSEQELGLAADADGLMELSPNAPVGKDIREYLALNDNIIEVDLTPNRADCLSIEGIAREVGVLNKLVCNLPTVENIPVEHQDCVKVTVETGEACPRYLGRLLKGVNPSAETPLWMQEKLRRSGLRSLGPLVDVTNFILLEMGQPLHAFDAAKLSGAIQVRMATEGEQLALLNDQTITLDQHALLISDADKALAFAGVMGGSETAVGDSTRDIFLECAYFSPQTMMGKARRFGLHTDSSHRFERGVDPFMQHRAIERASRLIIEIAGGKAGPITEAVNEQQLPRRTSILLRRKRIKKILGIELAQHEVQDILQRLGMQVVANNESWQVTPPGFRFDIAIEADLIEELGRVYGYNNLPQSSLLMRAELGQAKEGILELDRCKDLLVDKAYQEAITYSFIDEKLQKLIAPEQVYVHLQNPIASDMSVMRTTLWPGLLQTALRNTHRQQNRVRLFESGLRFIHQRETLLQDNMLAGIVLGSQYPEQWGEKSRAADFFDVKADVESLFALTRFQATFKAATHAALHPGQTAEIFNQEGDSVGWLGMLHPTLEKQLGFECKVFLFELNMERLTKRQIPVFQRMSKFPSVRRDLALIVSETVKVAEILACIANSKEGCIEDVIIFDIYRGHGIEDGSKSIALALLLQDSTQTLTDSEIDAIVNRVLENLYHNINAKLRE